MFPWPKRDLRVSSNPAGAALIAQMQRLVEHQKLIGGVGMVVRDGKTLLLDSFGMQDQERAIAAQPDTIFAVTSCTKPVTCAAAMTLVDEGKLSLDDPIHRFIPAFQNQRLWDGSTASEPIQVRHLMIHSSGLMDAVPPGFLATDYSLQELVDVSTAQPLAFHPGKRWAYSNQGFNVLGRILEVISGRPFQDVVQRRILEPLGMTDSFFAVPQHRTHKVATRYASVAGSLIREEARNPPNSRFVSPSTGLYSTARDLSRFWQMMLDRGTCGGRQLLSRASAEAMVANQTGPWDAGFIPGFGYGLGCSVVLISVGIFQQYSVGTFGHGGFYQTFAWVDPAARSISIFLSQHRCNEPVSGEAARFITGSVAVG